MVSRISFSTDLYILPVITYIYPQLLYNAVLSHMLYLFYLNYLYHLKIPHRIFYRLNLIFRASRLFTVRSLWLVIVFPLNDPMLLFHLGNIEIRDMKSILLLNPILDLLIRSLSFSACSINLIKIYFYLDMIIRFLLGQKNNRLNKC